MRLQKNAAPIMYTTPVVEEVVLDGDAMERGKRREANERGRTPAAGNWRPGLVAPAHSRLNSTGQGEIPSERKDWDETDRRRSSVKRRARQEGKKRREIE